MVLSSYGVRGTLTAYDLTALRFGTAGLLLLPIAIKRGLRIGPHGIWGAVLLALMMGAVYNTLCVIGFKYAPTSHGSIIQTTVLLLTTIGGVWLLREKLSKLQRVGVALSVVGIGCLLMADQASMPNMWMGNALFLLGGVMWSAYALALREWQADPLQVTAAVAVISAAMFLPAYFLFLPSNINAGNLDEAVFQAIYQGIINSILAALCYNRAVQLLGAGNSSAFLPLIPILAALMAMPLLGELPNALEWSGILIAALGVLMATGVLGRMLAHKPLP